MISFLRWPSIIGERYAGCAISLLLLVPFLAGASSLQQATQAQDDAAPEPQTRVIDPEEIPWPARLGLRVRQVDQAFPLIDRVVLVPDAATYVDELSKWSPRGRWPVLIEDEHFAPKFIRRFKPSEVIRREPTDALPEDNGELLARLRELPIRAWGGDPSQVTLKQVFDRHNYVPCGAVVASTSDPAWTAALALAAGRGQPLVWIDSQFHGPNATITQDQADRLDDMITTALPAMGYEIGPPGVGLTTVTICRSIATKVNLPRPDNGEVEPAAITDYLGRTGLGGEERAYFASQIFGDEVRSAYVAMCSLFLSRERVVFYNTYPTDNEFRAYAMSDAEALFSTRGYETKHFSEQQTTEATWLATLPGGLSTDVFVMNSRGREDEFHMREGVCSALDVPTLNEPVAVHWTHSWSMRAPDNPRTVAARWLGAGAYAYVGSAHEPYLGAFLPPDALAERWASFVPFLIAARHWGGPMPFAGPWKVNLFGDPLMLFAVPEQMKKERIDRPAEYGESVLVHARAAMERIKENESGAALAEAMHNLALLGRDELLRDLWQLARQRGWESFAARPALGPLFRAYEVDEFLVAWQHLPQHDAQAENMLWHLMTVRLRRVRDDETLLRLQSAVRLDLPHVDAGRLAPILATRFGREHTRVFLDRLIQHTEYYRSRRQLEELLRQH